MPPGWVIGIVVVLIVGVAVIVYGSLRDKELNQRREQKMLGQPDRAIPGYDRTAHAPGYVTAQQAHRPPGGARSSLAADTRADVAAAIAEVAPLSMGFARKDFVNDAESGWAVLTDPLVLVCAEPVQAIRELLPLIDLARRTGAAMVVLAPKISDVVLETLAVNRIQQLLGVVAVQSESLENQFAVAERTRAAVVDRGDLQAGYLPPDRVGRCAYWVSAAKQTWIVSSPSL